MSARNWLGVALCAVVVLGYFVVLVRSFGWREFFGVVGFLAIAAAVAVAITWCFA